MAEFLKEWGPTIVIVVAIFALVSIVTTLKPTLENMFTTILDNVQNKTTNLTFPESESNGGN